MKNIQHTFRILAGVATLAAVPLASAFDMPELNIELKGQVYAENTDYGGGASRSDSRTDLHFQRLRLTITGMMDEVWGFKFQTCGNVGSSKMGSVGYGVTAQDTDWNDRDIRIIDGYVIANFSEALNFKIGLTKIPLTRANLDDCFAPLSLDRSMFVYNAYGTSPAKFSRDIGAVAWGNLLDEKVKYFAGAFQGREGFTKTNHPFSGAVVTSSMTPKSNLEWVGRVHYAFLDPEPGSGYVGTYFGELKIFTLGAGFAYEPAAVYKNVSPTGAILNDETVDYTAYTLDAMFEYPVGDGAVTATAQYLKIDFDDAYKTNFNAGDRLANITGLNGQKEGGYVKAAYLLPKTFGKEGRLQPYAVYENWKFAHLLGINEQTITQAGVGLNYYIHRQRVRVTAEYLKTDFDIPTPLVGGRVDPTTFAPLDRVSSTNTFRLMLQVVI